MVEGRAPAQLRRRRGRKGPGGPGYTGRSWNISPPARVLWQDVAADCQSEAELLPS